MTRVLLSTLGLALALVAGAVARPLHDFAPVDTALAALVDRLSQDAVLAMTAAMRGTEAGSAP